MKEWWWTRLLVEEGHRFEHGEWRCADCRRTVVDLLAERDGPCQSPKWGGSYVFIGGPFDGRWQTVAAGPPSGPPPTFSLLLPLPPPSAIGADNLDDDMSLAIHYRLTKHTVGGKVMWRYVFEG